MQTYDLTTPLCHRLGVRYPIFAFSHSVEVTVAVTLAGGFAVLGLARDAPDEITRLISAVREKVGKQKFGVDLLLPRLDNTETRVENARQSLPRDHVAFVEQLAAKYEVPPPTKPNFFTDVVRSRAFFDAQIDAVLASDVDLVATAVGVPPDVVRRIKNAGKTAASLVGAEKHARAALDAGVDILVAQGTEAGGHTGAIGTFALVPQILEVAGEVPVIAAGGIGHGSQLAGALAMGAQGAWLGTSWLITTEHALPPRLQAKLIAARSQNTLITRAHSGKPCRVLESAWTREWHSPGAPEPLPMPYQQVLVGPLLAAIDEHTIDALLYSPAGQSVEWSRRVECVCDVMNRLLAEARQALDKLQANLGLPSGSF